MTRIRFQQSLDDLKEKLLVMAGLAEQAIQRAIEAYRVRDLSICDLVSRSELAINRLEREIALIQKMGFSGYFLIVSDFMKWAVSQGIPVGPGRGAGAGSLVAWSLMITGVDPLHYGLLFEAFLNTDRVSRKKGRIISH